MRIDEPIDKDTELHPLVRCQFVGGIAEKRPARLPVHQRGGPQGQALRHAGGGRRARGLAADLFGRHGAAGRRDQRRLDAGDRQSGRAGDGRAAAPARRWSSPATSCDARAAGSRCLPVPVSTPGFDAAPTLTSTLAITVDPESRIRNMSTNRAALKATDRLGVRMSSRIGGAGGYLHWLKYQKLGKPMPCAIVVGCAPVVAYTGPQKLRGRPRRDDGRGRARRRADPHRQGADRRHRGSGRRRDRDRGLDRHRACSSRKARSARAPATWRSRTSICRCR